MIGLYYYGEVTMKQIGAEIGVNESRVSQLHARAIRRLRDALREMNPQQVAEVRRQLIAFATKKPAMAKAQLAVPVTETGKSTPAVVLPYQVTARRTAVRATLKTARQRPARAAAAR